MSPLAANPFCQCRKFAQKRVHLGICGSVAAYKACELLRALLKLQITVSATLTLGARQFLTPLLLQALGAAPVYGEMFGKDNIFAHLEPGAIADAMLIAPASANSLAKMACGQADEMLAGQFLAFPGPCVIAPAMNPRMWANPATKANIALLRQRGCAIIEPGCGLMADGETGQGRLASITQIFLRALKALSPQDFAGKKVLVTMGPTREYWDAARFWSNPSSGSMGAALATAAWLRGAAVTALCGPGIAIELPTEIERINVISAREMFAAVEKHWPSFNIGIFCAAVADFVPVPPACGHYAKFKKNQAENGIAIKFDRNPDILAALARDRGNNQLILGFAAETAADMAELLPLARKKLHAKKADLLAANLINPDNCAFGAKVMPLAVVDNKGNEQIWEPQPKADLAWELLSWLLKL